MSAGTSAARKAALPIVFSTHLPGASARPRRLGFVFVEVLTAVTVRTSSSILPDPPIVALRVSAPTRMLRGSREYHDGTARGAHSIRGMAETRTGALRAASREAAERRWWAGLVGSFAIVLVVALAASALTMPGLMPEAALGGRSFYGWLVKPAWTPPVSLFGPIWAALYIMLAILFATVLNAAIVILNR
jgi:hypothetical protein